jgi:hypothetical protein
MRSASLVILARWWPCVLGLITFLGCSGAAQTAAEAQTPTPVTRAARTSAALAAPSRTSVFPTAQVMIDGTTGRPIWPTPPADCGASSAVNERPDLGPTIGSSPIWMASTVLPVIPWRNEFLRAVWVVERTVEGDLTLSGRRVDGTGAIGFLRQGGERRTEQLRIPMVARVNASSESPTAARYADIPLYLDIPTPGCWEVSARIGELTREFRFYIYS